MTQISPIAAIAIYTQPTLIIPGTPKEFECVEKNMAFEFYMIKKLAKLYNLTYKLDYINATVEFTQK